MATTSTPAYRTRLLDAGTWSDFAQLVEANNGVWGGCWCLGFHPEGLGRDQSVSDRREAKHEHVRRGTVHQVLVLDGDECVGWCQYGSPAELPNIKNAKVYDKELVERPGAGSCGSAFPRELRGLTSRSQAGQHHGVLPAPTSTLQVPTRDGRRLDVREWGDPAGSPVFFLHGTPGGALLRHVDVDTGEDVYRDRRLRVVTFARPGYGGSTARPGRRVVDDAEDVLAVADALRLEQFGVAGVSAGSGVTLAVAARLPDRAVRAAVFVGVVPFQPAGLDYFDGMDEDSRQWYLDMTGPDPDGAMERDLQETVDWVRDVLPEVPGPAGFREMIHTAMADGISAGTAGMRDDSLALLADWGFDVSEVRVPVRLLYAEDDTGIPRGHARWLRDQLPDCELAWVPGDHFGTGAARERVERELEMLAWAAPSPAS